MYTSSITTNLLGVPVDTKTQSLRVRRNRMLPYPVAALTFLASLVSAFLPIPAVHAESRAEICATASATQYFQEMAVCVTSVLPSQSENSYGPENLNNEQGAWCEDWPGAGIGEEIRFYFSNAATPGRFIIRNGYDKSIESFRQNDRVAVFRMRDDADNVVDVRLKDLAGEQSINVPWQRDEVIWIQFEIRVIYSGGENSDTCISHFSPDFEGVR
jgi:hypothetical protein